MPCADRFELRHPGFTAVEMVAVLVLAVMTSTLAVASLGGLRRASDAEAVGDRLTWANELVRASARRRHAPARLVLDAEAGAVFEQDADEPPRPLYRLPADFKFGQLIQPGGEYAYDRLSVPISAYGSSSSFAVQITGITRSDWLLISGLTGQVVRVKNELQAYDALKNLARGMQ